MTAPSKVTPLESRRGPRRQSPPSRSRPQAQSASIVTNRQPARQPAAVSAGNSEGGAGADCRRLHAKLSSGPGRAVAVGSGRARRGFSGSPPWSPPLLRTPPGLRAAPVPGVGTHRWLGLCTRRRVCRPRPAGPGSSDYLRASLVGRAGVAAAGGTDGRRRRSPGFEMGSIRARCENWDPGLGFIRELAAAGPRTGPWRSGACGGEDAGRHVGRPRDFHAHTRPRTCGETRKSARRGPLAVRQKHSNPCQLHLRVACQQLLWQPGEHS